MIWIIHIEYAKPWCSFVQVHKNHCSNFYTQQGHPATMSNSSVIGWRSNNILGKNSSKQQQGCKGCGHKWPSAKETRPSPCHCLPCFVWWSSRMMLFQQHTARCIACCLRILGTFCFSPTQQRKASKSHFLETESHLKCCSLCWTTCGLTASAGPKMLAA
jgi:hypothetical protein